MAVPFSLNLYGDVKKGGLPPQYSLQQGRPGSFL
jgi:hypothetical protein